MRSSGRVVSTALTAAVLVAAAAAPAHAAGESWQQVSVNRFSLLTALERSQGVATDGGTWFYSWRYGLSRTTLGGTVLARDAASIPLHLVAQGSDHIGDIDHHNGRIYAPIEDSGAYQHPTIALYDAATLRYTGLSYPLPTSLQTHVPWVAVDAGRGLVYTSDWDPVPALTVLSLADMRVVGTVPLSRTIGRIQGGHVFDGALYLSSDNATQSVYRVDPVSGVVETVLDRNLPDGTEAEGLAFLSTADGALMHVLDVSPVFVVINFRHYRRQ